MEVLLLMLLLRPRQLRQERKISRKVSVRNMLKMRRKKGAFQNLIKEMRTSDREAYFKFFRMSPENLDHHLRLVAPLKLSVHQAVYFHLLFLSDILTDKKFRYR